ncbi:spore germination protein [Bacillus sp. FJAT-29790]|uniref:GerAB/ArcD/ProY family transporter n=1 Tax=Bacillus sp. FJAT-29790 TaxID=1895002 RepID=UPI001C22E8BA|nr:GerAB/ArcD/ProY family transporter [Bacillus sp. FJAT-29790]MBU8880834.1 spore germination protein [Bacillus sp. FJAT-29790]
MQEHTIPERLKISPFLVLHMIMSMQIGIGILGYQREIAKYAGYDAWISILFAGACIHIILWMIYKIAETVNGDLVSAHIYIAGNFGGKLLSFPFILYFTVYALSILRSFIEIVQVWMFPEMSVFWFTFAFMLLSMYIVFGGFRTVVGITVFGLLLPAYLYFTFTPNVQFSNINNLLPIWDHSVKDLLLSAYKMSLSYAGFEIVLFFYPFIKNPKQSKKWGHLALLSTTFVYFSFAILSFAYFSEEQLAKEVWPTLTMWKIFKLSFVERFEYVGIANWNLIILPNVCIAIWVASRLIKRIFNIKQKKGIYFIVIVNLIVINFFDSREKIKMLEDFTSKMSFGFIFFYIPLLFIATLITKKVKKK